MPINPQAENISIENDSILEYSYYDANSNPIFKTVKVFKTDNKIIIYPYFANKRTDVITQNKIKSIEFHGWNSLNDLPNDFKKTYGRIVHYGLYSKSLKRVLRFINYKFKDFDKLTISRTSSTRFNKKSITIKWTDLERILKQLSAELNSNDRNVKNLINNQLAQSTAKIGKIPRNLYYGEFARFMDKYDSFEKLSEKDLESISKLIEQLPKNKIAVTSNFISTKNKINISYIEEILAEFRILNAAVNDNEKKWQIFFEKHSWVCSHLFPFDVILRQKEAYVGGKTFENKDGKVVDFLFQNGFNDNYALLEIKTHKKDLLKKTPYRGTDVFSMSEDLSGGINQCLDQKDNFVKEFGKTHNPIEPKCILIIGRKSDLNSAQIKCFELIRSNQKNVDIVTFDEMEKKIEGLLNVISK